MTVFPIVLSAIIASLAGLMKSKHFSQLILRFVFVFVIFYLLSSLAGILAGTVFNPGEGMSYEAQEILGQTVNKESDEIEVTLSAPTEKVLEKSILNFLADIVPDNIFKALAEDKKIQVVLFAILLGIAVGLLQGRMGVYLTDISKGVMEAFHVIMDWLLYLLPLGIISLLATQIAGIGLEILLVMGRFILTFFSAGFILIIINTVIIWKRSNERFFYVLKALIDPIVISLVTRNSFATLPTAIDTMDKKLKFYQSTSKLIIPFGTTVGRFGNILYFSLSAVFVAQLYGLELGSKQYVMIVIGSIFAGIATAGATGPATISVLSLLLVPLGLPIQAMLTVFIAIDAIIDPMRTLLIVHTNMAATSLVAERVPEGDRRVSGEKLRPLITLRGSIVLLISFSIILTGIITFSVAYRGSKSSAYYLAENIMQEITSAVSDKTINYMQSSERTIKEIKYLIEQDELDYTDMNAFLPFLRETLEINKEIGAIYIGTPDGNFSMTKKMRDESYSHRVIRRSGGEVTIDWRHENESNNLQFKDSVSPSDEGYDPRKRGWYKSAMEKKDLIWEDVYVFASDRIPGISCAIPVLREDGDLIGVLGIDIGVVEFSYFLGDIELSEIKKAVLLNHKDEIIAISTKKGDAADVVDQILSTDQSIGELNLVLAENSKDTLIKSSYFAYQATKGFKKLPVFNDEGHKFLTFYRKFAPNDHFKWSIGVVIPERSIMERVNRNNIIVLVVSCFFMALSLILGIRFSRSISRPLSLLSKEMEKVQRFTLDDIGEVQSFVKEVNEMNHSFHNMITGLRSFKKYVPSTLVEKLFRLGKEAVIGGEKRNLTLFFSDIRNFTSLSEKIDPEQLVDELVRYLSLLSGEIIGNSGTVDKYMGDGIMAFWGAPDEIENHAALACYSALECQKVLKSIAKTEPRSILANFFTRIGIHTGEVIVGNMGSTERLDYTVIGDTANLASRLEGLNKVYGTDIIISESTYKETRRLVTARLLDKVAVKGKNKGIHIYELVGTNKELNTAKADFVKTANGAANLYFRREWKQAHDVFAKILQVSPNDVPSRILLERCKDYLQTPPPDDWNGVHVFDKKY